MKNALTAPNGVLLVLLLALQSCGGGGGGSSGPLSASQWRQDIDLLVREVERIHPDLYHTVSRGEFLNAAEALKTEVGTLTRAQIYLRLKQLIALVGQPEDGHMVMPMFQATGFRLLPLRLYEFSDGVFVIDANTPHEQAIGRRVEQIGTVSINEVNELVDTTITRDNEHNVKWKRTLHYVVPELLSTLGITPDADQVDYLLEDSMGNLSTLSVAAVDIETYRDSLFSTVGLPPNDDVLYLSRSDESFWWQFLDDGNVLYARYRLVFAQTTGGQTVSEFAGEIAAAAVGVDKVVVDVRHNGGGDATTFAPLVDVLRDISINEPGKLYVLIDRATFSAAANFVTVLDNEADATFAGESTGGALNNYGDVISFDLPRSGFGVSVPTIYWQYAAVGDTRVSIEPDLPVSVTAEDYFAGRDPVLQVVISQ